MTRRKRRDRIKAPITTYPDAEGNLLELRDVLSPGTVSALKRARMSPGASTEDDWQRRNELIFERLVVAWTISGLDPLTRQNELLARFRMASTEERAWIRHTIDSHVREHAPELEGLI